MNVLYLHQYFVPPDGSGGTRSFEMARRLVQAGHDVELITSDAFFPSCYDFQTSPSTLWLDGIKLRVLKVDYSNKMSFRRRVLAFLQFAFQATRTLKHVAPPDVIFASSTPLTIALPAVFAKRRFRCPMVFEVRDLWPELPIAVGALRNPVARVAARRLEHWAYDHADHIVALSPGMKEGVVRAGYRPDRISVIPNGCDLELFSSGDAGSFLERHPYLKGGPIVTYAGTLGPINHVRYLVDIAAAMLERTPSVRFLVAGDGREAAGVRARAVDRGVLGRNFWMIPPLPKTRIPDLFAASSIITSLFVDLPAMQANAANKFFDGLAAGRPLMINYSGWQAELIRDREAGLVVPPTQPEQAAAQLEALLEDRPRWERACRAARQLAAERFDRDRLAGQLRGVLETAAHAST